MRDLVIIGAGGFGREVAWLVDRINAVTPTWNFLGYVDDGVPQGTDVDGRTVLGNSNWLRKQAGPLSAVCAIGASATREKVVDGLLNCEQIDWPNVIDPSVMISDRVTFGRGTIICAGSILTVDITLGDFCIINLDCTIGHDAVLHDFTTLYPSVNVSGATSIGPCSEMGTGSQIIQGKVIAEGSIVGAGAVVVRDIPADCTAVGMPAKPIKFHEKVG